MSKSSSRPSRPDRSSSATKPSIAPGGRIIGIWAAILAAAVLIVIATVAGQPPKTDGSSSESSSNSEGTNFNLSRRLADDITALGAVDAPVVIVEYADYRCPFCGIFDRDTLPQIKKEYIDKGLVRFEWRDLPVFGEQSIRTAVAARAAGAQGMFWEYHTAVFAAAPERGHAELTDDKLIAFARDIGVPDLAKFTTDLDSDELTDQVHADYLEGTNIGIASTPIFLVNETPIAGAQPADTFRAVIDDELAKANQNKESK